MDEELKRVKGAAPTPEPGPRDVNEARLVVESSRQRIADTLEEIEDRIIEQKTAIEQRLDVVRPVREFVGARPLAAMALAAGAGALLGLLTGGSGEAEEEVELTAADRAALRRWRNERRKRLLHAAEDELPSFDPPRSSLGRLFRDLTHELAGAATALLVAQLVERVRAADDEY